MHKAKDIILLLFEFKTHDQNNDTNGFYMFLVA